MRALIVVVCSLWFSMANAAILEQGATIDSMEFQDQFDQQIGVDSQTQQLLFSRNMKGGEIIQAALEANGDNTPATTVYVADISGMPSLIAKFVAVPRMKDLPFKMALDREGEVTKSLPGEKDKASLITLDNLKIVDIQIFEDADELAKALN
ncbi:hypothetical protein [Shewanella waksmanii]|uniref:hypothetical protein n=1 Tax=Shewanella waksmanii TaxID=213783 RepID=UPI0037352280